MKSAFLETPHNEIKCVLSMNESYFNKKRDKILHLPSVRDEGADSLPPYSQPGHNKTVFTTPLWEVIKEKMNILWSG